MPNPQLSGVRGGEGTWKGGGGEGWVPPAPSVKEGAAVTGQRGVNGRWAGAVRWEFQSALGPWVLSVWEAGSGSAGVWGGAVRESPRGKAGATERKGRDPRACPESGCSFSVPPFSPARSLVVSKPFAVGFLSSAADRVPSPQEGSVLSLGCSCRTPMANRPLCLSPIRVPQ